MPMQVKEAVRLEIIIIKKKTFQRDREKVLGVNNQVSNSKKTLKTTEDDLKGWWQKNSFPTSNQVKKTSGGSCVIFIVYSYEMAS